ncbi:MAG TPA: hypothetical protein VJ579_05230 [Candidatus Paceibacterota bacterium]|nr:hypothetical protein [Candidatus Paceibacterota bacterium]
MEQFFKTIIIGPVSAFLAQVADAPGNFGIWVLVVLTLVLFGGLTVYFIEHKKKTTRYHAPSDDGQRHDDII